MSLSTAVGTDKHQQDLLGALMPLITQTGGRNVIIRSKPSTLRTTQSRTRPKPQVERKNILLYIYVI